LDDFDPNQFQDVEFRNKNNPIQIKLEKSLATHQKVPDFMSGEESSGMATPAVSKKSNIKSIMKKVINISSGSGDANSKDAPSPPAGS